MIADDKPKKETKEAPAADPVDTGKDDPKGKSRGHGTYTRCYCIIFNIIFILCCCDS